MGYYTNWLKQFAFAGIAGPICVFITEKRLVLHSPEQC
jgi:hypothetical protein